VHENLSEREIEKYIEREGMDCLINFLLLLIRGGGEGEGISKIVDLEVSSKEVFRLEVTIEDDGIDVDQ